MAEQTIFERIVAGEIPSYKIYETDKFLAFLDISQFVEGHTIVIPKYPYRFIWDMPENELKEYWEVIQKIANHFRTNLGFHYVDTLIFGRLVPHTHVHLIPHNDDSPEWKEALGKIGEMQHDETRRPSKEKGEEVMNRFKITE